MEYFEQNDILTIYNTLLIHFGHRHWWPADTPFEVIIGAILTQNVSWKNVKTAIDNLKEKGVLNPDDLYRLSSIEIAPLIKSSRYYNKKAIKIKNFMNFFFDEYSGSISLMSRENPALLRKKLLMVKGCGEETVDSILLYACNMPFFVIDAYTKRVFSRLGFIRENAAYNEVQLFFMKNLPEDVMLYNDFHAQIVHLGNAICKTKPECNICPIRKIKEDIKCRYYLKNVY
jgi:endonuclease-3 related protein